MTGLPLSLCGHAWAVWVATEKSGCALQEQYDNSVLQIAQTERMFHTQRESLRQSTDVYGVTEIKYKEGVSSMTELLQDEMRLREAQGNLVSAHYQFNKSQVELLRLSGNIDEIINE